MRSLRRSVSLLVPPLLGLAAAEGSAQFDQRWLGYTDATATRLGVAPTAVSGNDAEVDFAVGDLDQDGRDDLVAVRKEPQTTAGKRTNLLLMNVGGSLVDRTAAFASAADVPGDQGFLTPTNDRDVCLADVDGDGWLDVVTAPAVTQGDPKEVSHPRIYRNLGLAGGSWAGLRYEAARIPQLLVHGSGLAVGANFCGVAAGDVDLDGDADLYFVDYDLGGGDGPNDLGDRLLINDGFGFFTDESLARVPPTMLASSFGTSAQIVDLNQDGAPDVAKTMDGPVRIAYGATGAPGTFGIVDTAYQQSAYHLTAGDLNNDGRPDLIVSDDGLDRHLTNLGPDPFGRVVWDEEIFDFLVGIDDGFGSNNTIADLDGDGWNDAIVADVDVNVSGCQRRIHLYHNVTGVPGGSTKLREERQSVAGGWVGAFGMTAADLSGGHDVAVLDVDGDGGLDLVLGRCAGASVWLRDAAVPPSVCQADLGGGSDPAFSLSVCGAPRARGEKATLFVDELPLIGTTLLVAGLATNPLPWPGTTGTLLPVPTLVVPIQFNQGHDFALDVPGGSGPLSVYVQVLSDGVFPATGVRLTNAVRLDFLP
ncbi:MAG: FG-GAP repeat domain-containing protein [Planctomycetota bacterium JB042]